MICKKRSVTLHVAAEKKEGPTEIRTRILGFRVPGANRYTIEPIAKILLEMHYLTHSVNVLFDDMRVTSIKSQQCSNRSYSLWLY